MDIVSFIGGIISSLSGLITAIKSFFEIKKLVEKTTMPDLKGEEKALQIKEKGDQETARNILILAGIEAAYNINARFGYCIDVFSSVPLCYQICSIPQISYKR